MGYPSDTNFISYEKFKEKYTEIYPLEEALELPNYGPATAISNVYLKIMLKKNWDVEPATIFTKDGKPAEIKVMSPGGTYLKRVDKCFAGWDFQSDLIKEIAIGNLPKFEKLTIYLKECGRNKVEDKDDIKFKLMVGDPEKKVNAGNTKKLVPACPNCDGFRILHHKKECEYCGESLEPYWRERKIYELEFNFNRDDWEGDFKRTFHHALPILYKDKICKCDLEREEQYYFLLNYSKLFPNELIGPFIMSLDQGYWTHGQDQGVAAYATRRSQVKEMAVMEHDMPDFLAMELFPKNLIYPKKAFYKEDISMSERLEQGKAEVATGLESLKRAEAKKEEREQLAKAKMNIPIDLNEIASGKGILDIKKRVSNVYLKLGRSARKSSRDYHDGTYSYSAQFYFDLHNDKKETVGLTAELTTGRKVSMSEIQFTDSGLQSLMKSIQLNQAAQFSEVKFFALESVVKYKDKDPHYYLKPILNTPGVVYRIPQSKYKIKACKACDTMLLNYSFEWLMQKEDLKEKVCPYCNKDLEIIERDRRVVPITLDFKSIDCKVKGTNNQIGVIYNGVAVKLTVKVKALEFFLQNYQNLFQDSIMGPFISRFTYRNRVGMIEDIKFVTILDKVEWRPVVLFPEDLIAF